MNDVKLGPPRWRSSSYIVSKILCKLSSWVFLALCSSRFFPRFFFEEGIVVLYQHIGMRRAADEVPAPCLICVVHQLVGAVVVPQLRGFAPAGQEREVSSMNWSEQGGEQGGECGDVRGFDRSTRGCDGGSR